MKFKYLILAFAVLSITVTANLFISKPVQAAPVNAGAIGRLLISVILHPTTIGVALVGIVGTFLVVGLSVDKK